MFYTKKIKHETVIKISYNFFYNKKTYSIKCIQVTRSNCATKSNLAKNQG